MERCLRKLNLKYFECFSKKYFEADKNLIIKFGEAFLEYSLIYTTYLVTFESVQKQTDKI